MKAVCDEKYFDHYFDTLANLDAGRDIFHYLARVDLAGFKPQAFPLTKYKKELKTKQTNNVVKWLLNMHEKLSDKEDDEIKEQMRAVRILYKRVKETQDDEKREKAKCSGSCGTIISC